MKPLTKALIKWVLSLVSFGVLVYLLNETGIVFGLALIYIIVYKW